MNKSNELNLRRELKYRIDPLQRAVLRKKLAIVLKPDAHAGPDGKYHIRNLYFDDFRNTALNEKISGVMNRKKYRIRIYNCSDAIIKFECKRKRNQFILKESAFLQREEAEKIICGDVDFLADSSNGLLKTFYLEYRRNLMRPVVIVDYYREAFIYPVGNVRVTFDTQLHTGLGSTTCFFDPKTPTIAADSEPGDILEVKFNGILPQHIRGLLPSTIRPASAIGKFAICRTQQINRLGEPNKSRPQQKG
jgi:hypothetical protein